MLEVYFVVLVFLFHIHVGYGNQTHVSRFKHRAKIKLSWENVRLKVTSGFWQVPLPTVPFLLCIVIYFYTQSWFVFWHEFCSTYFFVNSLRGHCGLRISLSIPALICVPSTLQNLWVWWITQVVNKAWFDSQLMSKQKGLKIIRIRKISQNKKDTYGMLSLICRNCVLHI